MTSNINNINKMLARPTKFKCEIGLQALTITNNITNAGNKNFTGCEFTVTPVQSRAYVKFLELGVRTPGVCFGRMVRRGFRFSAFSYAKPSDFRRNFRPSPTRIEVRKIFAGL